MCWFLVVSGEGGEPRLVRDASVAKTGEMRPCRQYAAGNATCHENSKIINMLFANLESNFGTCYAWLGRAHVFLLISLLILTRHA